MTQQQPQIRPSGPDRVSSLDPVTVPDFALVMTIHGPPSPPGPGPVVAGIRADGSLLGLLRYALLAPPPPGATGDAEVSAMKSALAYLVSRADALIRAGRGHLVEEAAKARARGEALPSRSYVAETLRDTIGYLCPAISEEAALNRPRKTWTQEVIVPDLPNAAGSNGAG